MDNIEKVLLEKVLSRTRLVQNFNSTITELNSKEQTLQLLTDSAVILQEIISKTRGAVITRLELLVNVMLETVYEKPHNFKIEFVTKRNTVEAELSITYDGNTVQIKKPFVGIGGGKLSVISIAFLLILNKLSNAIPLIILDETTKMVDSVALNRLAAFLKDYAVKNEMTILISTHQEAVIQNSNKVYEVTKATNISEVVQI